VELQRPGRDRRAVHRKRRILHRTVPAAWRGRAEIVRRWLERKDEPGDTTFRWRPLAVGPEVAVVQGETVYHSLHRTYSNLWVIRLDQEGRCTEFTEWWMQHPDADPA
jgi:hypothetical protein